MGLFDSNKKDEKKPTAAADAAKKAQARVAKMKADAEQLKHKAEEETMDAKLVEKLAKEVIQGKWGNGQERKDKLAAAGYDYATVQGKVNEMLGVKKSAGTTSPLDAIAKEVIQGKWGNGQERKDKLTAAGYDYAKVQGRVNEMLKK